MRNDGFTLIEILATIAIFTLGLLALAKMQVLSIKGSGSNAGATTAIVLAQRVMEDFKNDPYAGTGTFGTKPALCDTTVGSLVVACNVSTVDTTAKCLTVTVTWNSGPSLQLATIVAP